MPDYDPYTKLLNAAFRFVSFRLRSEKEIKDFLQKKLAKYKIYAPTVIKKVMDRLTELGYIDDAKFAAWWIQQRNAYRPKGKRLVEKELRGKGIAFVVQTENEADLAKKAIQKKLAIWKNLAPLIRKKKMYDFLARRGFSYETIDAVVGKEYNGGEVA